MKENLIYSLAIKVISKRLNIENPKVIVLKTKDELSYLINNNKKHFNKADKKELMNSKLQGYTLSNSIVLILDYNMPFLNPINHALGKIEIIAHELRHVWQKQQGWEYDNSLPYLEREHEKDAYKYAMKIVLPIGLAVTIPQWYVEYKLAKKVISKLKKK